MNSTATVGPFSVEPKSRHTTAGLDILVALDDVAEADRLADAMESAGHTARVLYNGRDALVSALVDPPDVAVLDVDLHRLDGWMVARRVREALKGRPCLLIAASALNALSDQQLSRRAGFDLHLAKPVCAAALLNALARYRRAGGTFRR